MAKTQNSSSDTTFSWLQVWAYWKRLYDDKNFEAMRELWLGIGYKQGRGDGGLKYILIDTIKTFPQSVVDEVLIGCPDDVLKLLMKEVPKDKAHMVKPQEVQPDKNAKPPKSHQVNWGALNSSSSDERLKALRSLV